MTDLQLLIGQSSSEGERKKKERIRLQRQNLLPDGKVDICPPNGRVDKCPPILEYRDIENRDKSKENRESNITRAPARGRYQNVMVTDDEYRELAAEIAGLDRLIEELSEYMKSTGRSYADHAATLRRWARKETAARYAPDYSCKEGESL